MSAETILQEIDALPLPERLRLLNSINERVMSKDLQGFIGIDQTFARYRKAMMEITGEDCTERTRRRTVVWARNIVVWQLCEDGFTTTNIGRRVGLDHSTVVHCKAAVREMLGFMRYYPEEVAVFRKFKQAIK